MSLERARERAMRNGLHFVYTGNVVDPIGSSTWCPGCGGLLVERSGLTVGAGHAAMPRPVEVAR